MRIPTQGGHYTLHPLENLRWALSWDARRSATVTRIPAHFSLEKIASRSADSATLAKRGERYRLPSRVGKGIVWITLSSSVR